MNHAKVINDVLRKYSDFPGIQADLKKMLKYAESQHRMFITSILDQDEVPAPRTLESVVGAHSPLFQKELLVCAKSMVDLSGQIAKNTLRQPLDTDEGMTSAELVTWLTDSHYDAIQKLHGESTPDSLRDDLEFLAEEINSKMTVALREMLLHRIDLLQAAKADREAQI